MRKVSIHIALILACYALLILPSCSSETKVMNSWLNHDINELIASWGPPTQILDDDQGGKIYCYQSTQSVGMPIGTMYVIKNVQRNRMFWVDGFGRIYKWACN